MNFAARKRWRWPLVVLFVGVYICVDWAAASAQASLCAPPAPEPPGGKMVCYAPSQVARAERAFGGPVISPLYRVWRITHLRLRQEVVVDHATIDFLFGRIPFKDRAPDYTSMRYRYALVHEAVHIISSSSWLVYHTQGTVQWHFAGGLPSAGLELHIETNLGRAVARRVGLTLLRAGVSDGLGGMAG